MTTGAANVRQRLEGLTVGVAEAPTWIDDTNRFWYRRSVTGGNDFVLVDATTQRKQPAFDHANLATGLSSAIGQEYTERTLPFRAFEYVLDGQSIEADVGDVRWRCSLSDFACDSIGEARGGGFGSGRVGFGSFPGNQNQGEPHVSPDGRSEAFIHNCNVAIRRAGSGPPAGGGRGGFGGGRDAAPSHTMLSYDGSEGDSYQLGSIQWSPDSRKLVAYRRRPGYQRTVYFVLSAPEDQLQPRLDSMSSRKPGDVLDLNRPVP